MPNDPRPDKETWAPTEHGLERGALEKRVTRGLLWTLIDTWGGQLLGLLIFALLARLLDPEDFGLVALAAVFVALGQLIVDQGLSDAVIQRSALTVRQLNTAFWVALLTGTVLSAGGILLAGPIATLLGDDRLAPLLQVLSLVFIVAAFNSIQIGLLRRVMNFRSLALRKLAAIAAGGAVGVWLALNDAGPWALVGQQLANGVTSLAMLWAVSPWRPGFSFSTSDFRSLFGFSFNVVAGDLLGFLSRNTDNLLIGVFLGPIPLGIYAVGHRILDTSATLLFAAARRLVFPSFARLQHDPERTQRAYLRMTRVSSALTLPGYVGLGLVAHEAILVIFGDRWEGSATVATVLFLIGPVITIQAFSGAVWNALGKPGVTLRFRFITTVTNVIGFFVAVLVVRDVVAVAAAFVLRGYLLLPLNLYWMRVHGGVSIREHLWHLRGVAGATIVMAGAALATKFVLAVRLSDVALLAAEVGIGALTYAVALWALDRSLLRELVSIALQAFPGGRRLARRLGIEIEAGGRRRVGRLETVEALQAEEEMLVSDERGRRPSDEG